MAIRGVLFDKDGTLIEMSDTWVPIYRAILPLLAPLSESEVEAMLVRAGYDPRSGSIVAGSVMASGTTQQLVRLWWPEHGEHLVNEFCRRIDEDFAPLARGFVKALMPLAPVFETLKANGLKLGVATNDSHVSAINHVTHLDVGHYFDAVIGADSVASPKPSGDMIRLFAEKTGLAASEVAMVGDNCHDMEEARHGGAGLAIAVLSGNAAHADIAHLADHVLDSIAELPSLLASL